MFDVLIQGGRIIDGSGKPGHVADVGISKDCIAAVGALGHADAAQTIDAGGLLVCPGFIDIHSHSDFHVLVPPPAQSKVQQGVTTEVIGNCGLSGAPLLGMARQQRISSLKKLGLDVTWSTFEQFTDRLQRTALVANIAPLIGHGNIRGSVVGYGARPPASKEMFTMCAMLQEAMSHGAWGLSCGLIYPPGAYAGERELARLWEVVERSGGFVSVHMRNEGDTLIESLKEVLALARLSGVSLQISHLKTLEKRNWHKLPAACELIERARDGGVAVSADRYPYTAANTGLDVLFPSWVFQGGTGEACARLRTPSTRTAILSGILEHTRIHELEKTIVISQVNTNANKHLEGQTLGRAAQLRGQPLHDALFDILIEEQLDVDALFFCMSAENMTEILGKNYVMVGSDAAVRDLAGPLRTGRPHPRAFGTFPRMLRRYVFEKNIMPLETAIHKMTGQPAEKIGLSGRGLIRRGLKADIVILDEASLYDTSTYDDPYQYPTGIVRVMVGGQWVLENGVPTGRFPGTVLLRKP